MPLSDYVRAEFIKNAGWSGAIGVPVGEDWSMRKFFRIEKDGRSAILMQSVPDDDPRSVMGHKLGDYVTISKYLNSIEVSAPKILAQDLRKGLLLVEDFGLHDMASVIVHEPYRQKDLYLMATRCLLHIYQKSEFVPMDLPEYSSYYVHTARRRVVDWYFPAVLGRVNKPGLVDDYTKVWYAIEKGLPAQVRRFLHIDFHPGNLMYLPERRGIQQIGLIDFQGAVMGPAPYDLVNLLEDARRDVPDDIKRSCLDLFLTALPPEDRESFEAWYPVLAAQFHFRIIGQAIKLALREKKTRLMDLLPILQRHIRRDLEHPLLLPMKIWMDEEGIRFSDREKIDLGRVSSVIADDAY